MQQNPHVDSLSIARRTNSRASLLASIVAHLDAQRLPEAVAACEAALQQGRLGSNEHALISCWLSEAFDKLGRHPSAIQALQPYDQVSLTINLDEVLMALVYLRLASAHGNNAELHIGLNFANNAVKLLERLVREPETGQVNRSSYAAFLPDYRALLGEGLFLVGKLYRELGEYKIAESFYQRAIMERRMLGDKAALVQTQVGLALLWATQGEILQARAEMLQAKAMLGEGEDLLALRGRIEMNLGGMTIMHGYLQAAISPLETAIHHFERCGEIRLLAITQVNYASCLMHLGKFQPAEEVLACVLPVVRGERITLAEINALMIQGEMEAIRGNNKAAQELLHRSIVLARQAKHPSGEMQAHLAAGKSYLLSALWGKAETSFGFCQRLAQKNESKGELLAATLFLAEVQCERAARDAATQVRRTLERLKVQVEQQDNQEYQAHWSELSGRLAIIEGDSFAALVWLREAVKLWELTGNQLRLGKALLHLASVPGLDGDDCWQQDANAQAGRIFRQLPAPSLLEQWEQRKQKLEQTSEALLVRKNASDPQPSLFSLPSPSRTVGLSLARLLVAPHSTRLLLQKLAMILHEEFGLRPVVIFSQALSNPPTLASFAGCEEREAMQVLQSYDGIKQRRIAPERAPGHYISLSDSPTHLTLYVGGNPFHPTLHFFLQLVESLLSAQETKANQPALSQPQTSATFMNIERFPGIIYRGAAMQALAEQIRQISNSRTTVLITGESGTGKELVARAIHLLSNRAAQAFIPFNCAATPETLMEEELFGHKKGAFTGATEANEGVIRAAEGGTLFLDEIGELELRMQPKLLRFLQEHEIQVIGENKPRQVDSRVIAATNCDLRQLIQAGRFRADLFYRLNVVEIHLPPLRERKEDIPILVEHFLKLYGQAENKSGLALQAAAMEALMSYDWPGNVRELSNEVMRLVMSATSGNSIPIDRISILILKHHAKRLPPVHPARSASLLDEPAPPMTMDEIKRKAVRDALTRNRGNITQAAKELQLTRFGLSKMIRQYEIALPD